MRQPPLTPRSFPNKMTDSFRTIDRRTSAYGEEEVDFVIQAKLFGSLNIFDGCAGGDVRAGVEERGG